MNSRHELSEKQWQKLKDYLPPQKPETGRRADDHNRLKQFRSIATRYDKRVVSYRAMRLIGAIILWL
jgi:transposase